MTKEQAMKILENKVINYNINKKTGSVNKMTKQGIEEAEMAETVLNLIKELQEENKQLKNILDKRFIYVTSARTVYDRLMSLDKEIIVKDDLKLRNEIKQHISESEKKDKIIDEMIEEYEFVHRINIINFCEDKLRENTCIQDCKSCIKQYFKKKAEEIN